MAKITNKVNDLDDPIRKIGPDSTATFDNSNSNPTERAGSESLGTAVLDEDDEEGDVDEGEDLDPMDRDAPISGADDADLSSADDGLSDEEEDEEEYEDDDDDDETLDEEEEDEAGLPVIPKRV